MLAQRRGRRRRARGAAATRCRPRKTTPEAVAAARRRPAPAVRPAAALRPRRRCSRCRSGMRRRWSTGAARAGPSRSSSARVACWRNRARSPSTAWPGSALIWLLRACSSAWCSRCSASRSCSRSAAMPLSLIFSTVFYASLYFTFADCFVAADPIAARRRDDADSAPTHSRKDTLMKKVAIVTGAGSGIGRATRARPAQRRLPRRARRPPRRRARGRPRAGRRRCAGHALAVPTDVTDPAAVKALFAATQETLRPARRAVQQRRHRRAADPARGADASSSGRRSSTST